jgi:GDP-4-dehydro-6-deoxy-D-mannose reductase
MTDVAMITGAAGFIGRHLASYLYEQHLDVHGLDRPAVVRPSDWPGSWHPADITDERQISQIMEGLAPKYIFHFAALIKSHSLAELLAVNVLGTRNLLESIAKNQSPAKVLIAGSSAEYGLSYPEEMPLGEQSKLRPLTPYGVSKIAQTTVGIHYAYRYGLNVICTRTFNVTGPGEPASLVCSAFARQIAQIEFGIRPPTLFAGNLKSLRDYTDVRDAVKAYWAAAQQGTKGLIYNVCSGRPVLIGEVLKILCELGGLPVEIRETEGENPTADVPVQYGDFTRLNLATGWSPTTPLSDSLSDLLEYWRHRLSDGTN